jgi:hypothetical protein
LESQSLEFLFGELEAKVFRESADVALDSALRAPSRRYVIKRREVGVDHHLVAANQEDSLDA